jgi:uncharacterized membrane protein YoaK (UPF0700 family)
MTRTGRQEIYTCLHNNWDRNKRRLSGVGASAVFACVGGILDAFTYFGHGRVFANSMTGNVVLLGVNVIQADSHQALRHLFPICSFFVGISAARISYVERSSGKIRNPDRAVLTLEIGLFGAIGCLPDASSDFLITTPIAFVASLQSEAFRRVEGFPFNSTFTTGNLRTLSESVFDFLFDNSQLAAGRMVRIFSVICSSFLLGAITGSFMTQRLQNKTLWIVSLMLAFLWVRLIPSTRGKTSAFINELGDAAKPMRAVSRSSVETTCRHLLERRRRITTTIKEHPLWQR